MEYPWTGTAVITTNKHWGKYAAELQHAGEIEQVVDVRPNTTYVLSAWVKTPGTNERDKWFNAYLGAKDYGGPRADVRFFLPGNHCKSVEFTTGSSAKTATIYFNNRVSGGVAMTDDVQLVESLGLSESK